MPARLAWALACVVVCRAAAADTPWTVTIAGGGDYTFAATSASGNSELPAVDVRVLARDLNLAITANGQRILIRDADGFSWTTTGGSSVLQRESTSRTLSRPAVVTGAAVRLALDDIATLAGRRMVVDGRHVWLVRSRDASAAPRETVAAERPPDGWSRVLIPKTAEELAETRRLEGETSGESHERLKEVLPPSTEALAFDVGLGLAQAAGGAADVRAAGSVAGVRVNLGTFVTFGQGSATYRAARLVLQGQDANWMLEAGDMLSDVRGLARGLRVEKAVTAWWHPSVAVYTRLANVQPGDGAALAYRDTVRLPGGVELRGEAVSDASTFGGVSWRAGRTLLDVFYRRVPSRQALDRGASVSYDIWNGVTAQFGANLSSSGAVNDRWYFGGLSVPVGHWATASFERTARGSLASGTSSVGVQLPLGAMTVMQRYQWSDDLVNTLPAVAAGIRQMQSVASYMPVRGVHLSYQLATQWSQTNVRQWTELQTAVALSPSTSVHAISGFPNVRDAQHFRVGFDQRLGDKFRLTLDYGHLPGYQAPTNWSARPDPVRLVAMIHRTLTRSTPAGGHDVRGRIVDDAGRPVAGAAVRLGPYVTAADVDGTYRFPHVPRGEFEATLDPAHLPVGFAPSTSTERVTVANGDVTVDWRAVALQTIRGQVFEDRNGNGQFDAGEGVTNVVMRLGDAATATDAEGAYAFFDLLPGRYQVRVDVERLDHALTIASSDIVDVDVASGQTPAAADFAVARRTKPIVIQRVLP